MGASCGSPLSLIRKRLLKCSVKKEMQRDGTDFERSDCFLTEGTPSQDRCPLPATQGRGRESRRSSKGGWKGAGRCRFHFEHQSTIGLEDREANGHVPVEV